MGRQAALDELWKAINGCLETCGQSVADIGAICIGMAGMDYEEGTATEIVAALKPELPEAAEVIVYDDAVISLASGTGGQLHGCVVVVGELLAYPSCVNTFGECVQSICAPPHLSRDAHCMNDVVCVVLGS